MLARFIRPQRAKARFYRMDAALNAQEQEEREIVLNAVEKRWWNARLAEMFGGAQ